MATVHGHMPHGGPLKGPTDREQLRRDRISLMAIIGLFAILIALMVALISSGILPSGPEFNQPWMMP